MASSHPRTVKTDSEVNDALLGRDGQFAINVGATDHLHCVIEEGRCRHQVCTDSYTCWWSERSCRDGHVASPQATAMSTVGATGKRRSLLYVDLRADSHDVQYACSRHTMPWLPSTGGMARVVHPHNVHAKSPTSSHPIAGWLSSRH